MMPLGLATLLSQRHHYVEKGAGTLPPGDSIGRIPMP